LSKILVFNRYFRRYTWNWKFGKTVDEISGWKTTSRQKYSISGASIRQWGRIHPYRSYGPSVVFLFHKEIVVVYCEIHDCRLETLSRFGPRSIILSSGTLSPIPFLQQELLLPFPVQLSNPHIIKDNQLFVGVFKHGPGNVPLSSSYENRDKKEYLADLGESILKICSVVPGGVLVFFPSYASMDSCVKPWRESGVMNSIQQFKVRSTFL